MSHTSREKTKLLNRVRRIKGQMEAVERLLEEDRGCTEVLQLVAGIRGAINGLMGEIIEDHIRHHVADGVLSQPERDDGALELIDVVRTYLK
ncbi:metal/formaldehyde-sensitive transcriptional repressor [Rhizobium sp. 18055]|uniref:metal/formaldehyde-sensitive transcriptional repressor n=1 Tax=Rhizobium sp. 18055 TaxID=2681403 RepID=UPI0013594E3C|nr:metal/formaldehyde-sensitive transcriptional repressor [Rhizobium sp. 18055]